MRSSPAWDPLDTLDAAQRQQINAFEEILSRINDRVNLISPGTEGDIRTHHTLHCLALAVCDFPSGSTIVDWGTGGGLPAIPLAIRFPGVTVIGVDSVGKKVRAVRAMVRRLGLDNCYAWEGRAADWGGTAQFSVSRATAPLATLWRWHQRSTAPPDPSSNESNMRPTLLALKGGDLSDEITALRDEAPDMEVERRSLKPLLGHDFFAEKEIVAVWT